MDLPVTPQDQMVIQQICDIAAMSPNITRQVRSGIAGWCVQWETRVQDNNKPKPKEEKK